MNTETIPEMLKKRVQTTPDSIAHYTMIPPEKWKETTWKEYYDRVCELNHGFANIGLKPGHKVGIMVKTSQIWEYIQMSVLMAGGIVVGIDPSEIKENINTIVKKAHLSGIFVQDTTLIEKIDPDLILQFEYIVSIKGHNNLKNGYKLSDIRNCEKIDIIIPDPDDPATIIFTSGTTGEPKGICYSHLQVALACQSILRGFPDIDSTCNLPCWLPLSNLFQRIINFCAIDNGASTYFIENPREMLDLLPKIQPHLFIGVPRVFEKLYTAIETQIMTKSPLQKWLIKVAINAGDKYARSKRNQTKLSLIDLIFFLLMDRLILKKIRAFLGTRIKYLISGSAPMPKWLLERYHALGILVLEAYGISENIIPNAMNVPDDFKFGTVGKPLKENKTMFLEDGELLVKGIGVFSGYLNDSNQEKIFTSDGYFPTGDYASFDKDGYLSITGRKSEVFKTSTGRKISPVSIESRIQRISYIEHTILFGSGKKFLTGIVFVSAEALTRHIRCKVSDCDSFPSILSENTLNIIGLDVFSQIKSLPNFKQPAGIFITDYLLSVEKEELTSNLKLKRKNIKNNFIQHIEEMYDFLEKNAEPEKINYYKITSNNITLFF